ncbi:MAG: TRAP transporter small permease protein [Rhodospirillaceae bacterium]|jgi:TRAP-type C4-dicarboxylate transport system permease small subunit|nr:TRAP transporter small permease [Pseudomonadota bacterium]MEC8235863.1 TRAP transporter small permease [Pseudomonadota bacterium]GIR54494.1 MAG: TRAP transporter small permease protein [Rhodospirillaceae bacterium]
MLESIHSRLERISQLAVWVGGAALLAAALMVTVDVLSRKIFSVTMSGSDEYSGYVFSATTTWAYSYCLLHRSNVRIDALYNYLPRKVTAILDVVGLLLLFYFMSIMTYYAMVSFVDSWVNNSVSITTLGTPQWIPQLFWVAGLILFFVTLIFVVVYSIIALLQRNWDLVARVAGVPSIAETMQEETHGIDVALVSESSAKAKE